MGSRDRVVEVVLFSGVLSTIESQGWGNVEAHDVFELCFTYYQGESMRFAQVLLISIHRCQGPKN